MIQVNYVRFVLRNVLKSEQLILLCISIHVSTSNSIQTIDNFGTNSLWFICTKFYEALLFWFILMVALPVDTDEHLCISFEISGKF
jgi:membrane protein required for beta-lactamase induction